jgi:hypothetical protein
MKRIAFAAVAVIVVLWVAALLMAKNGGQAPSPVHAPRPPLTMSPGAARLIELEASLELDHARDLPWRTYLDSGVVPPPPDVAAYFRNHVAAIDAVRTHLLSRDPIAWPATVNWSNHMLLTRMLAAHAQSHRDWSDLEAGWDLQRSIWSRPDTISCIAALSGMRIINSVARNLPPPAPPWLADFLAFDVRRAMLAGQLAELESIRGTAEDVAQSSDSKHDLTSWLRRPYDLAVARNFETVMRTAAMNVARFDRCNMDERVFEREIRNALPWWNRPGWIAAPNLGAMWQRVGRFRAERQETAKRFNLKTEPCGGDAPNAGP